MRPLVVTTFLTLDGVMQAPGGPEEDPSGGFSHGGWSVNYWDEQMGQVMGEAMSRPFDLVLGRKTYDIFAAYWPHAPEEAGAKPLNDATKYVASRTHPAAGAWQREPDPDAVAPRPCRPVPPVGIPPRHWVGQTPVLGRHHPLRAEARRQQGLDHWSCDGYVRAGRRGRHRILRAGLSALVFTSIF